MNRQALDTAIQEAERFLKRARTLQALPVEHGGYGPGQCPERAAVKRSSLDLSMALALVRK